VRDEKEEVAVPYLQWRFFIVQQKAHLLRWAFLHLNRRKEELFF